MASPKGRPGVNVGVSVFGRVPDPDFTEARRRGDRESATFAEDAARALSLPRFASGDMFKEMTATPIESGGVDLGNPTDQAYFNEFGTGLYGPEKKWIEPETKKALRWFEGGGTQGRPIFARRVRGIRPHPFIEPAIVDNADIYAAMYANEVVEEWNRA